MKPSKHVLTDFLNAICGEKLGEGIGRTVFACSFDPTVVIKVEQESHSFQNVREWEIWNMLAGTSLEKYLAPVRGISPCGTTLIMARVEPLPRSRYKTPLPQFLSDLKPENYGLYKGRVVACDYGSHLFDNYTAITTMHRKLRVPKWNL